MDSSCCTYIPDYDGDGKIIEQGLANLTQLPDTIDGDFPNEESWIDWLFSSWRSTLSNLTIFVLLIFIISICACSVLNKLMGRAIQEILVSKEYQVLLQTTMLQNEDETDV